MSGYLREEYLFPCCCIHDSLSFDMQYDHVPKKWHIDILTPSIRSQLPDLLRNLKILLMIPP